MTFGHLDCTSKIDCGKRFREDRLPQSNKANWAFNMLAGDMIEQAKAELSCQNESPGNRL